MMRMPAGGGWQVMAAFVIISAGVACAQENVALGRPFTCSTEIMDGWTGLVDGITDSDSGPGCFATSNDHDFPKSVTIDLQRPCNISHVAVHSSENGNTRGIIISCSQDGVKYETLREFIFPQAQPLTLNHRFNARPAQFIRVEFTNSWGGGLGGDHAIFCREVEVFGTPTGAAPAVEVVEPPDGDPLVETRDLRLFLRWALKSDRPLSMAVLGDSLAGCAEASWPQTAAEKLQTARDDAPVAIKSMGEAGMLPTARAGHVGLTIDAQPDIILVTFGTDLRRWDRDSFHAGLADLIRRLLDETDALVVLVGPVADGESADSGRRALLEMERLAALLSVPLVRTEAALLSDGLERDSLYNEDGELSDAAKASIATSVVELLLQP
jgi:hypothetical protein